TLTLGTTPVPLSTAPAPPAISTLSLHDALPILRHGLAGAGHLRLLTGDRGQVADRALDQLGVTGGVADAHVHHDLDQAGHLHDRSEEHTSELQSRFDLVCRLLLETQKETAEERS